MAKEKIDKLDIIFETQLELQTRLNQLSFVFDQQKIDKTVLCIVDELFEFLRETNYKYWREEKPVSIKKLKEEYIDIFKFVLNLGLLINIDSEELFDLFMEKTKVNYRRIGVDKNDKSI